MATTGHEKEAVNIEGLKASLQKFKDEYVGGGVVGENVAYLGDTSGSATIPGFDAMTDTLHVIPQVLTTAQKTQAKTNIGLYDDVLVTTTQSLTTAQKDQVAQNLNNRDTTNGMGRVELKASDDFKTVVESYTQGGVVFVIKYDYTLTGDVTVPANCVLEFDGGSISGEYTITGTNTNISGNPNFNCTFSGTFKNDWFETSWFPAKTIYQIADICRNFKYLYINTPYTLSSVLDLTDVFNVKMDKDYITTTSDNYIKMGSTDGIGKLCRCNINAAGHITIIGGYNLDFNIGYCQELILEAKDRNIGYSHFYCGNIQNFYIESYNNYWCNSNIFNIARIQQTVTLRGNGTKLVSSNIFNDCVLECITMSFVKACSNRFYNTRMEGTSQIPNNISFDTDCYDNVIEGLQKAGSIRSITGQELSHTNVTNNGFDSNVVRFAPSNYDIKQYNITADMLDKHPLIGISKGANGTLVSKSERTLAIIEFNELHNNDFGFILECDSNGGLMYYVELYDKSNNKLTSTDVPIDYTLQTNVQWYNGELKSISQTYIHSFCLFLSKNTTGSKVAHARVRVNIAYNKTIQYLNITTCTMKDSSAKDVVEMASPKYGDTRPVVTNANIGFSMFDTTIHSGNGGPIWYKGNGVWVDATGATV